MDVVSGLEIGADDYLSKPFSPKVLRARVKALLRRNTLIEQPAHLKTVLSSGIYLDPRKHISKIDDKLLELSPTEFRMLYFLMKNPDIVYSRQEIVENVQGTNVAVTPRSVDVQILSLRRKLGKLADCLETVRGVGYKFVSLSPQ